MNHPCPSRVEMASGHEMMYLQRVKNFGSASWCKAWVLGLALSGFFAGASSSVAAPAALSAAEKAKIGQAALDSFQAQHKKVEALVHKKADDKALQAQVDALLDYQELAHAALGGKGKYAQVCKSQCKEFEAALSDLIRGNYLRFLRKSGDGRVEYLGAQVARSGKAVKINTRVHRAKGKVKGKGRNSFVSVAYVLRKSPAGAWRAADLITEGVSLRKTYRFEFKKVLEKSGASGGIKGVIAKIRAKIAELGSKK